MLPGAACDSSHAVFRGGPRIDHDDDDPADVIERRRLAERMQGLERFNDVENPAQAQVVRRAAPSTRWI